MPRSFVRSEKFAAYLLIVGAFIFGTILRLRNLESKIVWYDESLTLSYVAGLGPMETLNKTYPNGRGNLEDLRSTLESVSLAQSADTLKAMLDRAAPHLPFYFLLTRVTAGLGKNSILQARVISVIFAGLSILAAGWLGLEIFQSPLMGAVLAWLFAVSPFHMLYSQEARPYSLWILSTILSLIFLSRALRSGTKRNWLAYGICLVILLQSHIFSWLGVGACLVFAWAAGIKNKPQKRRAFWIHSLPAFALYALWALMIGLHRTTLVHAVKWIFRGSLPAADFFVHAGRAMESVFFEYTAFSDFYFRYDLIISFLLVLLLTSFALLSWKRMKKEAFLACAAWFVGTIGFFWITNLFFKTQLVTVPRYYINVFLALEVVTAFAIAELIRSSVFRQKVYGIALLALFLVPGLISCLFLGRETSSYAKGGYDTALRGAIGVLALEADATLIVSENPNPLDRQYPNLVALAYSQTSNPAVFFVKATSRLKTAELRKIKNPIFFNPPIALVTELEKDFSLVRLKNNTGYWGGWSFFKAVSKN